MQIIIYTSHLRAVGCEVELSIHWGLSGRIQLCFKKPSLGPNVIVFMTECILIWEHVLRGCIHCICAWRYNFRNGGDPNCKWEPLLDIFRTKNRSGKWMLNRLSHDWVRSVRLSFVCTCIDRDVSTALLRQATRSKVFLSLEIDHGLMLLVCFGALSLVDLRSVLNSKY